jgi:GntR family transcriptional regulator
MKRGKPEKFSNLAEDIRQLIYKEQLKQNETLPSERKLAEIFSVNHLTVRKALKLLEQQGIIYKVPSRGNFVGTKPVVSRTNSLIGLLLPEKEIFFF